MKASTYHLQINVSDLSFYANLFAYLEFPVIDQGSDYLAVNTGNIDLWAIKLDSKHGHTIFHRKTKGLNHLAFRVRSKEEVDRFYKEYLLTKRLTVLYGGPKSHPEYDENYYSVYFEDPDRLKLEVMSKS